ncbi:MAG: hypothetical protein IPF98_12630 [Gemmatimonadetes bacterium]|nr:hypothetical protein [Gemmatimonadota bacterium]MCC6771489.1 hypothetical protein [Gemmatimonadaceae bacterium]
MNSRSAPPDPPRTTATRLLPWLALAVAVIVGVILTFRYGPRIAPLIDGIR